MSQRTCSLDDCPSLVEGQGLCSKHYQRLRSTGSAYLICKGCGAPHDRTGLYCSEGCRPPCKECGRPASTGGLCESHLRLRRIERSPLCVVDECNRNVYYRRGQLCNKHYQRWKATGTTDRPCPTCRRNYEERGLYCSEECKPRCKIEGCESPAHNRGWCRFHNSRWQRFGEGFDTSPRPDVLQCAICGDDFSLSDRSPRTGRIRNSDAMHCGKHSRIRNLKSHFLAKLVRRDGPTCGICGDEVDLTLQYPDPGSPSVDHVIPWSQGGPDHMDNLRLTCLSCNLDRGTKAA